MRGYIETLISVSTIAVYTGYHSNINQFIGDHPAESLAAGLLTGLVGVVYYRATRKEENRFKGLGLDDKI